MIPEHMYTSTEMYAKDEENAHAFGAVLAIVRQQDKALDDLRSEINSLRKQIANQRR
jgi:hypothetical protein